MTSCNNHFPGYNKLYTCKAHECVQMPQMLNTSHTESVAGSWYHVVQRIYLSQANAMWKPDLCSDTLHLSALKRVYIVHVNVYYSSCYCKCWIYNTIGTFLNDLSGIPPTLKIGKTLHKCDILTLSKQVKQYSRASIIWTPLFQRPIQIREQLGKQCT